MFLEFGLNSPSQYLGLNCTSFSLADTKLFPDLPIDFKSFLEWNSDPEVSVAVSITWGSTLAC